MDAFKTFTYTTKITMLLLFVVFAGGIGANADDSLNKFDDPSEKSFEAGAVTLVQNANREVVEIRVEDCTLCNRISYLPRHDLEVKVDGELVGPSQYPDFNGWPGAIVFNEKNLMVLGVYYWSPDLREGE